MKKICSFEGCNNKHKARGYCAAHWKQWRAGKNLTPIQKTHRGTKCSYDGCDNKTSRREWCQKHYDRWLRTGSPEPHVFVQKYCKTDGCDSKAKARGWCTKHWHQAKMSGEIIVSICKADGCNIPTSSLGLCAQHYIAFKHHGLEPHEFDRMFNEQNGVCAICGKECASGKRLAIDHNHTTGRVRGLLCSNCNTSLGGFMDSEELLMSAVSYLRARD